MKTQREECGGRIGTDKVTPLLLKELQGLPETSTCKEWGMNGCSVRVQRRNQPCQHLASDFWPPELGENKCLLPEATQFVVICLSSPGILIYKPMWNYKTRKCISNKIWEKANRCPGKWHTNHSIPWQILVKLLNCKKKKEILTSISNIIKKKKSMKAMEDLTP